MSMRNLCQSFNIYHIGVWISKRFYKYCLCILLNRLLHFLIVKRVNKSCTDSIRRQCMCKKIVGSTINILCGNDMVSILCKILKGICNRSRTGCYCQCCYTSFKSRNPLLKNILCGICQSSVDIARICQVKSCRRMLTVFEYI